MTVSPLPAPERALTERTLTGSSPDSRRWDPAAPTVARGTVVILAGRGESAGVYERFGRRLAADSYAAQAWADLTLPDAAELLTGLAADATTPLVLVGSDSGSLAALTLAVRLADLLDGLVLVGTPTQQPSDAAAPAPWSQELETRTACPVHRSRLETEIVRGALTSESIPPALLTAAWSATPELPTLVLHGTADLIAPVAGARALADRLPAARLVTIHDGRHDVLNDVSHRSVAAEIIQFLERLRSADYASPILTVEVA